MVINFITKALELDRDEKLSPKASEHLGTIVMNTLLNGGQIEDITIKKILEEEKVKEKAV